MKNPNLRPIPAILISHNVTSLPAALTLFSSRRLGPYIALTGYGHYARLKKTIVLVPVDEDKTLCGDSDAKETLEFQVRCGYGESARHAYTGKRSVKFGFVGFLFFAKKCRLIWHAVRKTCPPQLIARKLRSDTPAAAKVLPVANAKSRFLSGDKVVARSPFGTLQLKHSFCFLDIFFSNSHLSENIVL